MDSFSPSDAQLRTRIHQQEVVADLGRRVLASADLDGRALESDDRDDLIHESPVAVAGTPRVPTGGTDVDSSSEPSPRTAGDADA